MGTGVAIVGDRELAERTRRDTLSSVFAGLVAALAALLGDGAPDAMRSTATSKVELRVRGIRSEQGVVLEALHDRAEGFPGEGAIRFGKATVSGGKVEIAFDVPPGEYAISCFHDENGNGKLDTNWLGIPKEGVCASNDATRTTGPPRFRDAKFDVADATVVQTVTLVYP
jgi:uncharacterized protein (DUF2141 family)